jgi:hypothetical protein
VTERDFSPCGSAEVAAALLEQRAELSERIAAEVLKRVGFFETAGEEVARRLPAIVLEDLSFLLGWIRDGGRVAALDPARATARGRERAGEGYPPTELLEAYRIGGRLIWEAFAEEAHERSLDEAEVSEVATLIWGLLHLSVRAVAEGYSEALSGAAVAQSDGRSMLLATLLERPAADAEQLSLLAAALRLPIEGPFVAVATGVGGRENPMAEIEVTLRARGWSFAWELLDDGLAGVVQVPNGEVVNLVSRLRFLPDLRLGMSPLFIDLASAASAVRLAKVALLGTAVTGERVGVFEEQPILMAALSDPDVASHIHGTVLGGLDTMPDDERALLIETFHRWLDAGGSSRLAAEALFCHPNTVRNRLRRLERATNRELRRPKDLAELCLALAAERSPAAQ